MKKNKRIKNAFFMVLAVLITIIFIPKNIKINMQLTGSVYYDELVVQDGLEEYELKNTYENMYIGKYSVICKWPSEINISPMQYIDATDVESINLYYGSIRIGEIDKENIYNTEDGLYGRITYSSRRIFFVAVLYALIFLIVSWCIYKMLFHFKFHRITLKAQNEQIKLMYVTLIYILSIFLLKNTMNIIKISNGEILAMGIGLYITLLIIYSVVKELKLAVLSSAGAFVGLYIAVNNMTSFLTVDENRAITEQARLSTDILRHWELGSSRLNYIIMGSAWKVIKWIAPYDNLVLDFKLGKLIHWICGVVLIAILVKVIVCGSLRSNKKNVMCSRYIIIWFFIVISPTMLTILKNYNYDLFAVMFGCLAVFTLLTAFEKLNVHLARVAVGLSCLATLEKIIAEPVMVICMIMYVYIAIAGHEKFIYKALKETIKINAYICTVSLMCNLYIQYILRNDWFPNYKLTNVLGPLLELLNKIVTKVFANIGEKRALLMAGGMNVLIVLIGAIVIHVVTELYKKEKNRKFIRCIVKCITIVVVSTTIIGIIETYLQKYTYFYPYYKQNKNVYMTYASAIAKIFHYNALNQIQFYAKSCLAMLIVFVNAMPTYIVILLILVCIWLKKIKGKSEMFLLGIIGIFGSIIPVLYGMICMEPNPRYQNLYIIIITICVLIVFLKRFDTKLIPQICTYVGLTLTCIEVVEFAPANTGFFPYWNINHCQYNNVEIGKMTIGWYGGWGEDIALAGEKIEKYIDDNQLNYETVNMYMNYHGSWLNNIGYNVYFMPGSEYLGTGNIENLDISSFSLEKNDFYVFVRWGCIAGMTDYTVPPGEYEPIITIKRRGAIEVWIYTGDQLEQYFQSVLDKKI